MKKQKKDCLAIIGAGEAALPIIDKAKIMNIKTIAFGRNDSIAKNKVDIFIEENSFDIDFICDVCKEYQVNGVIASSELTTEVTARVAHQLNLPGNDISGGFAGKNKYLMRCRVKDLDSVKQPKFELYNEKNNYAFPVVVKAVDSSGKRGVRLAQDIKEFETAVLTAKKQSSDGTALIEEYLEGGQEYSIECLSFNGEHYILQYTEKDSSGPPHFVETGHHQPATLSALEKKKINNAIKDILSVLGIGYGMSHAEIKLINDDVYFIEVGARAAGDHIADILVPLSTGFDYFKAAIECSLGTYEPKEIYNKAYSGLYYYCKQNESLKSLFELAPTATWCYQNNIKKHELYQVTNNVEAMESGYIIYHSDSKIDMNNYLEIKPPIPIEINSLPNAYEMIWNHYKEIGRDISEEELDIGIKKFLNEGHAIGIVVKGRILAFRVLYCNHVDTLDAYVCNGYVLEEYRGLGYSVKIFEKVFEICRHKGFKSVSFHVKDDNHRSIYVTEKLGFKKTGKVQYLSGERKFEMRYYL